MSRCCSRSLIAIPLGIAQAVKRNSIGDYTVTTINFVLYSMPSFFLGLILIQIFALDLGIFPPTVSDQITTTWQAFTHPKQLFLPIVTLAAINVASFSRYMRSSALDNLAQDYIRLARAKGLSERAVLFRHLLRNACLPMITLVGLSIPALLAGNLLIEVLFNYPGLGLLFYNALGNQDYDILLAYTILGGDPDGPGQPLRRHCDHGRGPQGATMSDVPDGEPRAGSMTDLPSEAPISSGIHVSLEETTPEGGEVQVISSGWKLAAARVHGQQARRRGAR